MQFIQWLPYTIKNRKVSFDNQLQMRFWSIPIKTKFVRKKAVLTTILC